MSDLQKLLEDDAYYNTPSAPPGSIDQYLPFPDNQYQYPPSYDSLPPVVNDNAHGSLNNDAIAGNLSTNGSLAKEADPQKPEEYKTYHRRWYVLILFSLLAFTQSATWNTWGPIGDTAEAVLGWSEADIALLTNWGPITYVVSAPLFSWMMDVKGLKMSMLTTSALMMLGCGLRCIPVPLEYLRWVMNAGHFFIGLAGPVLMGGPPLVSATWFPPHQRTTSTAISTAFAFIGIATSFLIGPLIVTDVQTVNSTAIVPLNDSELFEVPTIIPSVKHHHIREINLLMYIEAAWMLVLFIATWVYFPAKPPTPPSASAETKREVVLSGARILFTSLQFWLPALSYSISTGVMNCWFTQLDTIFEETLHVDQGTVGWIGFWSNIASVFGSLILARYIDYLGGKMKMVLLIMASCGAGFAVWIVLLCLKAISFNLPSLYISLIGLAVIVNSTVPLYFEVTVEGTYPVAEGLTAMVMTWMNNFYGLVFLLVLMIPDIGVMWTNYVALGAVAVCIPLLLGYKEKYNRLNQDTEAEHQNQEEPPHQKRESQTHEHPENYVVPSGPGMDQWQI